MTNAITRRFYQSRPSPALICVLFITCALYSLSTSANQNHTSKSGQQVYNYYCYQCHGYRGDANTTTSQFVNPKPANFNSHTLDSLTAEQMVYAITNGVTGTAMVSFSTVLTKPEISAVVEYIRLQFMSGSTPPAHYHSEENGWTRFTNTNSGIAFRSGGLSANLAGSMLSQSQRMELKRYQTLCISCHEFNGLAEQEVTWNLYSVSYPVGNYEEEDSWPETPIPTYELHEHSPPIADLSIPEQAGETLFQARCAHCHAEDGSGKNWIGRFLDPPPGDIRTSSLILPEQKDQLLSVINNGFPGTSMPAWKNSLTEKQIAEVIAYLHRISRKSNISIEKPAYTRERPYFKPVNNLSSNISPEKYRYGLASNDRWRTQDNGAEK